MSGTDHLLELESLRSQVAELARDLAERDQSIQDLREQSHLLHTIVEGTAAETGDEFFASLVTHLTSTLHVQYAVIGEVLEGRLKKIRTLAVSSGGILADNFEYELANTPCRTALAQSFACFERGVRTAFPEFQRLADLGVESYCGVPLRTKGGVVVGLLVVMDTKPLQHVDNLQSLLGVFAPRVAVEFERRKAEQEHTKALAELHDVMETIPDIIFSLDAQGNMTKWNRRVEIVTGYSPEELSNKPALAFVPPEEQTSTAAAIQQAFMNGYAELEGHLLTKDQQTIPYHWTGAALKDPDGRIIGISGVGRDVSEKKRVEEELQHQRRHLMDAQALAHLGSWDWDIDSGEVEWSNEQFRIFGHEPGARAVTYDTFLAALHPDDHDPNLAAINDALLGKRPYDVECRIVRPNGDVRFIHVRGEVHRDATGHPLRMTGTVLDITERKQGEESLRASEERWQLSVRGSTDGIWDWNIQTGEVYFSARWKSMRGYEESELANSISEWQSRIHPDDIERVLQRIDQYLAKQRPEYCEEYRVERKDGSYMWVLDRGIALWADDGTPLRMAGSESDITEHKRVEEALRESEVRFDLTVRGSNTGIWDWDLQTNKVYFSSLWKSMLGYGEHELLEEFSEWEERLHPDDRARALATVRTYLEGTTPQYELEHRLRHKDGSYRWILARGVSISDAKGNPYRMAGSHLDITEWKQTQEALAKSERRLRTVLDALPVGVWFTDRSGKPLLANPAAKQIWSNIEQIGLQTQNNQSGWWETIGPAYEPHRWVLSRVLTTGVPSLNETFDLGCLDGTKKVIRNSTVPILDEAGVISGAIVLNEDITDLREAQKRLRLTQFSVDHAVEGFFWVDPDSRIISVNDAACRMLEYTRDELTTITLADIDPNFSPEAWPAHWEELKQKGSLTFESKHWSRTGRVLDTEVTVNYLQYEGKEYNCAVMRDIGERKRAEEAFRASEERHRALYDDTPTIYFTLATDGTVRSVNRFGAEQLGYRVEELVGHSVLGVVHEHDKETIAASLSECLMTPESTRHWEIRKVRKDGHIIWVQETARVVRSSTGETVALVTCEDITERKRMEDNLRQRERDLCAASEERERISQYLHDGILQSLFAVGLTLETTKSMLSPKIRKTSGAPLDQAIDQLNRVMSEIRNFIAGMGSELLQENDLPTAMKQILESLTENKPTRVRLAVEDRAVQAVSAEQSLHLLRVVQEAVSNCIRHGRAQEARVSLKMLKQGVRLSVRDNGRGFNPDRTKGIGHGLGNMAARAQKIGGRFTVLSKVNEGTRVVFDLPKGAAHVRR